MNDFSVKLPTHMLKLTVIQRSNSNFAQYEVALCRCIFDAKITQQSMKNHSLCVLRYIIIDDYRCVWYRLLRISLDGDVG